MKSNSSSLKTWLHRSKLNRLDKLLLILASFDAPCQVRDIRERGRTAGFRILDKWNVSSSLSNSKGLAIRTPEGWELTGPGHQHLNELGLTDVNPPAAEVAADLRRVLPHIRDAETRDFVHEAVSCYECGLYRSAIVMSWIGAVSVLHKLVVAKHLRGFNAEAMRVDSRWRGARTTDDLTRMREAEFLDRLQALSIIGKDVKMALRECLDRRNSCGHPNSFKIAANTAAHHVEVLLLNVFTKFQ